MRCIVWVMLASASLVLCACESPEQPPAKPAPLVTDKPVAKNATVPDTITLDTSQGVVTLSHLAHAKRFQCNTCHSEVEPGQIAWDKDTAHAYCRDCHMRNGKGPTTCTECHKK